MHFGRVFIKHIGQRTKPVTNFFFAHVGGLRSERAVARGSTRVSVAFRQKFKHPAERAASTTHTRIYAKGVAANKGFSAMKRLVFPDTGVKLS